MNLKKKLRNYLIAGTLALIPLTITYLILTYLFGVLDNLLMPLVVGLARLGGAELAPGSRLPGVGILATLVLVLLIGLMTRNYLGRKLLELGEWSLQKIPLVGGIYHASKQLVDAFSLPGKKAFREVVLVEYPRRGIFSLGFITSEIIQVYHQDHPPLVPVILPHTPTPLTGTFILVPEADILHLPLSVEDGIKLIVSGGILTPRLPGPGHSGPS